MINTTRNSDIDIENFIIRDFKRQKPIFIDSSKGSQLHTKHIHYYYKLPNDYYLSVNISDFYNSYAEIALVYYIEYDGKRHFGLSDAFINQWGDTVHHIYSKNELQSWLDKCYKYAKEH